MQNILVFCLRDWLHPQAGPQEHYVHEVCRRIAAEGYFVTLVASRHPRRFLTRRRPDTEHVDGIHVARLGPRFLYPRIVDMFLAAWARKTAGTAARKSEPDVVFECVSGRPLNIAGKTDKTVIPIVFDLDPSFAGDTNPPGPIIAASDYARRTLLDAGVPRKYVITAGFGGGGEATRDKEDFSLGYCANQAIGVPRSLLVAGKVPWALRGAVRMLRRKGIAYRIDAWSPGSGQSAHAGFCNAGWECCAADMAYRGIPVLIAESERAHEYVAPGETGFYLKSPTKKEMAERLESLAVNESLRELMSRRAREYSASQTWDKAASLALAAIENLHYESSQTRPQPVRRREEVTV